MKISDRMSRLGTETAFEVLARAEALARAGRDIINLGIGQPDFRTPEHIVEAAVKALRDGHHGYTPAPGILPLREAVAADLERTRGVAVDPDRIVCVPGGKVTMFFAILMFGEPGAEIMYPNPGFPIYESVINYSGATAVPIPLIEEKDFSFDADEVLSLITPNTRLMILNTPTNPTGGAVPRDEIEKLVAGLEKHPHVAILADEIYSQMTYDGHEHVSLLPFESLRDRLILLDGWSKTYAMTGWRLGYGIMPEELVPHVTRLAVNSVSCAASFSQRAAIAALDGPQDDVKAMTTEFAVRRRLIADGLRSIPGINCPEPEGAFYAFPSIKNLGMTSGEFEERALSEAGVALLSGAAFGEYGEGYIRLSYANSQENIKKAIDRLDKFVRSL